MNCYTVLGSQVQLGIALSFQKHDCYASLSLGKKTGTSGREEKVILSSRNPASHVLVAGGIYLMRTAELHRTDGSDRQYLFVKAKNGLKADMTDMRALVLLDFLSRDGTVGYTPKTYQEIPVAGFEVIQGGNPGVYRVQALVILQPNQHIMYVDVGRNVSYTLAYDFDAKMDRFPRLFCMASDLFRTREPKKLVAV